MSLDMQKFTTSGFNVSKSLQLFFGVGLSISLNVCHRFGVSPTLPVSELPKTKLFRIRTHFERKILVENRLRYVRKEAVKRLMSNESYRGIRLGKGLPVRGQRTRSNARTQKFRKLRIVQR